MSNLRLTLTSIALFSTFINAKGITIEYLDEMMVKERTQIKSMAKIAKYCDSLTKYGFTAREVSGCIYNKNQYHAKERLRVQVRNKCLKKHIGNHEKIIWCIEAKYILIRGNK
ncbi:MAG: hypothetical protein JXQ76_07560 [Campylobacterales bacterium]|nr:hypothetical protein [Campylobacterales bacterium]